TARASSRQEVGRPDGLPRRVASAVAWASTRREAGGPDALPRRLPPAAGGATAPAGGGGAAPPRRGGAAGARRGAPPRGGGVAGGLRGRVASATGWASTRRKAGKPAALPRRLPPAAGAPKAPEGQRRSAHPGRAGSATARAWTPPWKGKSTPPRKGKRSGN